MSLIRKNDEHWKDNVVGLTLDVRLRRAMSKRHNEECQIARTETMIKKLKGNDTKIGLTYNVCESTVVSIINPLTRKIKDVGFNIPQDLVLDNFGNWFAGIMRGAPSATLESSIVLVDDSNTARTLYIHSKNTGSANSFNGPSSSTYVGTLMKAGSGATAAARSNYKIQTSLANAPESGYIYSSYGSYATGMINGVGVVTCGGSETVQEIGLFGAWAIASPVNTIYNFMLFHDVLGASLSTVAGDAIDIAYGLTM